MPWRLGKVGVMGLCVGLLACRGSERASPGVSLAREVGEPSALAVSTRTGVHGMVVFGDQGLYLYHLPMWHGLHAWQIVIEASLDEDGRRLYDSERAAGSPLVTFEPEPFALASLKPGFKLEGKLYHGHFEQGGTPLPSADSAAKVSFTVQRLIMVKALRPSDPAPFSASYRVFGREGEWFGVHVASRAPDFDQILRLESRSPALGAARGSAGVPVTASLPNDASHRPVVGTAWTGLLEDGTEVPFTVQREEYFSTTDLGGQ
ncbi:hypothetical protein BON30_44970 [Cystobacter ferrugineus]|uniref:Lipoprotein n=2 Tax=Cystobacter ferrugineus TaxID=83449 RepID=A0A1L9AVT1_9BACT|nr:hypothetical protein BON30_44970 [Cystobacter ferrugineus]